ncbi:hypothetical protein IWGMT90018_45200 [Mycobacterium kiyosense]|nr:hypothetical protein IWGMT90018_45200 [Mycobacterium kiyosense]
MARMVPPPLAFRWGDRGLGGVDDATQVDAQHMLPIGFGHILELDGRFGTEGRRTAARHDSRVGPGDVKLAEMIDGVGHRGGYLVLLRDVGGDCDRVTALLLDQL